MGGFDLEASPLAADPEWWARLVKGYQDCYDISESLPQTALNRNPMKKMFGRQMMFWLESYYAPDERDMSEFGFPEDKYEAAGLTLMVQYNGASEEEKFLSNFFWGSKW